MQLWTDAIDEDGYFDPRYTCDVDNSSPELRWVDPPVGTAELALVAEDPDARGGVFSHWVVYNIPATVLHLPTGIPPQDTLPNGIRQGLNGMGKLGYFGPCPPRGDRAHRYRFTLFALREHAELPARATREALLEATQGILIETSAVEGRYTRAVDRAG